MSYYHPAPKLDKPRFGFVIIKPDAVKNGNIGHIISDLEHYGFGIVDMFYATLTDGQVLALYREHYGKDFFQKHHDFIRSGPVVCIKLSMTTDHDVAEDLATICGLTDPTDISKGQTLRYRYGSELPKNAIHFSDNEELADFDYAICCPKFMITGI